MKHRWLVVLALLSFLATLILHAPVGLLYAWSQRGKPAPSPTVLHGLQGTLAQGGFASMTVNGRPVLKDARWTLQPLWLALLRFTADLETGGESVVRVRVSRTPFGALRLSDLNAAGSVKALLGTLGQPALPLEGQARPELPVVRLDHGVPVEARGSAQLESLAWTLAREPLQLGSFVADLDTDDKGIAVNLASGSGPIEMNGTATLAPTRTYDVHLQLRARPEAPAQLQTLIQSIGQPDAQGWYHIRRNGTLAGSP